MAEQKTFLIQEEARCLLNNYVTATSKEEALEKLSDGNFDSVELEEIQDTIQIFENEIKCI